MIADTQMIARQIGDALQRRDRAQFVSLTRRLLAARHNMNSGLKSLADPLLDYGERALAKSAIDQYVVANNGSPAARFDQALTYLRAVGPRAAFDLLAKVPRGFPDPAGRAYLEGSIALNLGETDHATEALRRAQKARPGSGQIYHSLSTLGSMTDLDAVGALILDARRVMASAAPSEQGPFLYALGKVHADRGEYEEAFDAFAKGARLIGRERPHDAAFDRRVAAAATQGWDTATIERIGSTISIPTGDPIIVTGLPRSGSTLVEHILTSHSGVGDGEEIGKFGLLVGEIGGLGADDLARWGKPPQDATALYLHLFRERFPAPLRGVDKTLEASRYMGLLAALLPDAPIVWLRRTPLDNAWSAYRTYFARGVDWSWSLTAIAEHIKLEDALFAAWRERLGDRILVVDYEQLVSDKQAVIPRILGHCGLSVEEAAFHPERSDRAVTTNSVTQVRSPISTRSVGAAEPYRQWLSPFIDRYGAD